MKTIRAALFCVTSLIASLSHADVTAFGATDCGKWVKAHHYTQEAWLLGFLTGMNGGLGTNTYDPLAELESASQAFLWMDNYCQKNPLGNVATGGVALYMELQAKVALKSGARQRGK